MFRFLVFGDVHYWGDPRLLSNFDARHVYQPTMARWLLRRTLNWILQRSTAQITQRLRLLEQHAQTHAYDGVAVLGDECSGIADRGIEGSHGLRMLLEYRAFEDAIARRTKYGTLIRVPSEHTLGLHEGTDYYPVLGWRDGKFYRKWKEIRREIGGGFNLGAIRNWTSIAGPLWGVRDIEGFRLVWMDYDLIRWYERFLREDDRAMLSIADSQCVFLHKTLEASNDGSVILFTHRPDAAWESHEIQAHHAKLCAVVFGDLHTQGRCDDHLKKHSWLPFQWCFVPALWGLSMNMGPAGYAVLELDQGKFTFHSHYLTTPLDA